MQINKARRTRVNKIHHYFMKEKQDSVKIIHECNKNVQQHDLCQTFAQFEKKNVNHRAIR